MGTIGSEYVSPRGSSSSYYNPLDVLTGVQQQQQQAPATTTLPPQIYPVGFTSGAAITQANISAILLALNVRLATLEDVYTALGFGLNWCYPTYVQKSITDTSVVIYAASQPGKCGPSSGRQMIKVKVDDDSKPQFVFVFGPKPADEATIMTSAGEIVAGNFYEPITGTSGFRNMYPSMEGQGLVQTRYDASKLYESFFAESNTCYSALACTLPVVQTLVQQTTAGTTTIDSPIQVSVPTLTVSPATPQGSSSYEGSITNAQPAVVIISSTTTTTTVPQPEIVVPSQTTLATLQAAYVAPAKQGSSSSQTPKSIGGSATITTQATTTAQPSTKASPSPKTSATTTTKAATVVSTQPTTAPAAKGKVTQIKYVAKPGDTTAKEKSELTFYDPKAGFFSNLLGEFVYDFGRVVKGVQVATS
jgi:hypothetical protein